MPETEDDLEVVPSEEEVASDETEDYGEEVTDEESESTEEEELEDSGPLTDTVVRAIRTYVPVLVGTLVTLILKFTGVNLGGMGLEILLTSGITLAWWSLWAYLERKWPWLGWLNGHPKPTPTTCDSGIEEEETSVKPLENPILVGVISELRQVVSEVVSLLKDLPEKKTVGWKAYTGYEVWPPEIWPAPEKFEMWPQGALPKPSRAKTTQESLPLPEEDS